MSSYNQLTEDPSNEVLKPVLEEKDLETAKVKSHDYFTIDTKP